MKKSPYIPALDGLRFFAFLLVLLHHFSPAPGFGGAVAFVQRWGWMGVDLFFVLSSFLITRLLMREYDQFDRVNLKNFWVRRILRIWPLYYLIIFLTLGVLPYFTYPQFGSTTRAIIMHNYLVPLILFYSNFIYILNHGTPSSELGVLWTISVEEHFYLLWPVIFIFILRNKLAKHLVPVAVILIAIIVAIRYFVISEGGWSGDVMMNSIFRCDSFLIGALCAVHENRLLKINLKYYLGAAFSLLALVTSLPGLHESNPCLSWQLTLISIAFACLILAAVKGGGIMNNLKRPSLVYLGKISYGLYMFHEFSFLALADDNFTRHLSWLDSFLLSLLITVALASISYFIFERFFLNFKRQFT